MVARQDRTGRRQGRVEGTKGGGALDPGPLLSDEGLQAGSRARSGRVASPRLGPGP